MGFADGFWGAGIPPSARGEILLNITHPKSTKKIQKLFTPNPHPRDSGLRPLAESKLEKKGVPKMTVTGKQLRLDLESVIQMMKSQAAEGVVIQKKEDWPPIAWMILQCEAEGRERDGLAKQLGIAVEDIDTLVADLIQAEDQAASEQIWQVGVIALKTAAMQVTQVIGKTWDQIEAMAIEKLAEAIQGVNGKAVDPEKLAGIAKIANSATRRNQGEGQRGGFGGSTTERAGSNLEVELKSGDLGSITFRFSPRVAAQMQNPNRVIDLQANREERPESGMEMLRLKEIRPIAEAMESDESKAKQAEFEQQQAESKSLQDSLAPKKPTKAAQEMERLKDMFGGGFETVEIE